MIGLFSRVRLKLGPVLLRALLPVSPRSDLQRLGGRYGGWIVPRSLISRSSVCYCVGVGEDITFDLALIETYGCPVYAFDPTPRAAEHVKTHAEGIEHYHYEQLGLWSQDTTQKFYAPGNHQFVSHSIVNLSGTQDFFEAVCKRLSSIMRDHGHNTIDLLKLDIEGAGV